MTRAAQTLVVALALAPAAACGPSRSRMLDGEIAQAVQTSPGHVDLAALYPADWDRVCILGQDAREARVNELLGFPYPEGPYLSASNDTVGLVFVRGSEVVTAIRYARANGDFAALGRSYCLSRPYAVFHVVRRAGGSRPAVVPLAAP